MQDALAGSVLRRGELRHPRLSTRDLTGQRMLEARSIGKHVLLRFDSGRTLHNHLRMDGAWHLYGPNSCWQRPAHQARAILADDQRTAVGFNLHDLRLLSTSEEHAVIGHLGPDVLDPQWTDEHHVDAVRRMTTDPAREIGLALLDQSVLAGVGNLYKTEVCFLLGVRPRTPVVQVDADRAVRLSRDLLRRNAWHPQQTTTGRDGPRTTHWVYRRRQCRRCDGRVRRDKQGAEPEERVAYYCPHCQIDPEGQIDPESQADPGKP